MTNTRVKISSVVQNQLPDFIKEEYPLVGEFLKQYYNSVESQSGPIDILQNIDQYLKIDQLYETLTQRTVTKKPTSPRSFFEIEGGYSVENLVVYKNGTKLTNNVDYFATDGSTVNLIYPAVNGDVLEFVVQLPSSTFLSSDVDFADNVINVESTYGFPDKNGLIEIDSEIILYESKTPTSFIDCTRGFSGTTSYTSNSNPDQLVFSTSEVSTHLSNAKVTNLSSLFLKEFILKIKKQLIPGFENRTFVDGLNEKNFIKEAKSFYSSKGTVDSYKVLFKALYGEEIEVIKPRDFLLKPSDAQYRTTRDLVVESISGNPLDIENRTLYQDKTDFFKKAYGTVTKVEKIQRGDKDYYVISLDYDYDKDINVEGSVYGEFSIHPSTKITSDVTTSSSIITVDSTIGFPLSGELIFNIGGIDYTVSYFSKNTTEFFILTSPTVDIPLGTDLKLNAYAYAYVGESLVKVRVTGVLSDITFDLNNVLMSKDDTIKPVSLGYQCKENRSNNWVFNIPNKYNVKQIDGPKSTNLQLNIFSYNIITYDEHNFKLGDFAFLISNNGSKSSYSVIGIDNEYSITIQGPKINNINLSYILERNIKKVNFENYSDLNSHSANIQNIYIKNNEDHIYVTSNCLPDYLGETIRVKSTDIIFSGSFNGETLDLSSGNSTNYHGLITGDSIVYIKNLFLEESSSNTLNIDQRTYYVKKIDDTKIKLSNSRADLFNNKFISVSGNVTNNVFKKVKFLSSELSPQNYIKKIINPTNSKENTETPVGPVGIFVNGVEAYNYKSNDRVYYGGITSIDVLNGGKNYDVMNPPEIFISDSIGTGATAFVHVNGSLDRIDIIDGGFDYIEDPIITITGGNGYGAYAKPNLTSFKHSVFFNSTASSGLVNLTNNTIGFSTYHKFRDFESIIYLTQGQSGVGGLSTNAKYFVNVQNEYSVKLHKTIDDAVSGINTVDLTGYGTGVHALESYSSKRKISSISVLNSGSGYSNKKTSCSISGINTATNTIRIPNHGYNSGETIVYGATGSPVGGLTNNQEYYVTKVNKDEFKLSQVGFSTDNQRFYYLTNQFVNLTSAGSSIHTFNYPNIVVSIKGKIGVSTLSGQDFNAKIQPVFRGSITNVFVKDSGVGYGSSEIINYERQPNVTLKTGSGAQISPVVNNGKITEVLILNRGSNYTSAPTISISGVGTGAILTPIVNNGELQEVKVINGGIGFNSSGTSLSVISSGEDSKFECRLKSWIINNVERYLRTEQIKDDDGIVDSSSYTVSGSQYCHLYVPRKLRQSVFGVGYINGNKTYLSDLKLISGEEVSSDVHSPIIGWAYDGNPIYGPYGYSNPNGTGSIRSMISGYSSILSDQRPDPISGSGERIYPNGFFIEDYQFNNNGDLDEHNGRFCVTPEYPEGVYAYFSTINNGPIETNGVFKNYKKPTFPYIVGNTFKSDPIEFNYDRNIDQNTFDFSESGLFRNTKPYNLTSNNSDYSFVFNPIKIKEPISVIKSTSQGSLIDIGITTGGSGYRVGDKIVFNNENTGGSNAYAEVSYVKGKNIKSISFASTFAQGVEFYPFDNTGKFVGFCSTPHNLINKDVISITGLSTFARELDSLFEVGISSNTFSLSLPVGSSAATGIITYFNINGSINYSTIRENDIYKIDSEKVKILSVDKSSSRIKVLREYDSTVGSSHTASTILYEQTRKLTVNLNRQSNALYNLNKELYFDPKESLGIGLSVGVGVGHTLLFSNPGAGISSIFIPTKTIYIPQHSLETGTELIYSTNGGTAFGVSVDGSTSFQLIENQKVYVAKVSEDLIGISTYKVGLGSDGSFVGINSSVSASTLYFTDSGLGSNHSFKTNYENVLSGEISRNTVTVSTASSHGLLNGDLIYLNSKPGLSTSVVVKYNDKHRRLVVNPITFATSAVSVLDNTITILNHGYVTGQKIIYTSTTPIGGLTNDEIYYIVRFNKDKFKLSDSYYNAIKDNPETINFSVASGGTISLVNPNINIIPNQTINFNLSDSSLSFNNESSLYSAFEFVLFSDPDLTERFSKVKEASDFDVAQQGKIGIDSSCTVTLRTSNLDTDLYYALVPINLFNNKDIKKQIIVDNEYIKNNNKLSLVRSLYSGFYNIVGSAATSFKFNILDYPEKDSYLEDDGLFEYYTNSKNTTGEIQEIDLKYGGKNYFTSPGIASVFSSSGSGSILYPSNYDIGRIKRAVIDDIGFDYPTDTTLSPTSKLPQILNINPLSVFESVGVTSVGLNYTISPNLIVIDSYTNEVVSDVDLNYDINSKTVNIIKNTDGIYNSIPTIIPVNNSNGVSINNISFNEITKDVTIELGVNYSYGQVFPFNVGDKILIENTSIVSDPNNVGLKGYNSSDYDYSLFTLTSVNPQFGGSGANIVYNLSNYLKGNESLGTFDPENSAGIVVPEKYFPIFNPILRPGKFLPGEKVISNSSQGNVINWNENSEQLKISTSNSFDIDQPIRGESSGTKGTITGVIDLNAFYTVSGSSIVNKGWNRETGFLNNRFQVTSDNNYYQYFSYSLRSKVDYESWNKSINNFNHTVGFKKFGDLIIESTDSTFAGISTTQNEGSFISIADLTREIDLNCVNDFDLANQKVITIGSDSVSKEVIFNSVSLQDELLSIGNRVLSIDDISDLFSNELQGDIFVDVDSFSLSDFRSKKYLTFVKDKIFTDLRQIYLVSILHDGLEGYISQYSRIETDREIGSFDFSVSGSRGVLSFFPLSSTVNDYDISTISYGISDLVSGIGSESLGNIVKVGSSTTTIPSGTSTATNIVSISSTFRSSKVLVQLSSTNETYFEFNEITLLNDGVDVNILEYGKISNANALGYDNQGIGTYNAYISGTDVKLDFIPNVSLATTYVANTLGVSIASTTVGLNNGTITFRNGQLKTNYVSISSSPTPTETIISSYSSDYSGAYCVVVIEDNTNNRYQVSEVVVIDDDNESYLIEFGNVENVSGLGTFGIKVGTASTVKNLCFTPNPDTSVLAKVYQNSINVADFSVSPNEIDLINARIESGSATFKGTYNSSAKSFELFHQGVPIFQREFDASDSLIVNVNNNTIRLPKHFFVTGEQITYDAGGGTPIGIATTSVPGIGVTDILPSSVFVIKLNDLDFRLADSAENALKSIAVPLVLSNVGIGTSHTFTSKKQNNKCLITIDNFIQSPIVSTAVTTTLSDNSQLDEITISLAGITSIFSGDLLKISDEIVKVNSVGYGGTNILLVDRGWVGTNPQNHSLGSLVTKITGNYNIIDNTIHFVESPYGKSPIGISTNDPNDLDYLGITSNSTFNGRVFLRSGIENGTSETYDKNYIFDDISESFDGVTKDFTLKSSGANVSGLSSSPIVLVNNVFQEPQRLGPVNILGNYKIQEISGITTLSFVGNISSTSYDVNTSSIPRGGVIVSVASTYGFGYQPLISAGGTSIVSAAGTISSISVGYTGSGYRGTSKYEIITQTSVPISVGSTIIPIDNANGVFRKLGFSSTNTITVGIGSSYIDAPIVSIADTYVTIGTANTCSQLIPTNTSTLISINSPSCGFVDVGVKTSSTGLLNYEFIGFATVSSGRISQNVIITNPGSGYTSSNPPTVVFDSPLNYSNIPLVYSSGYSGVGTSATVDIIVGQGSSVIDFQFSNLGYGYRSSEILTIPTGGLTGIPTDSSKPFRKFELTIDEVFSDSFSSWSMGEMLVIDKIESLFNGNRQSFPIKINGTQTSIRSRVGSNINVQDVLLVFINDILQIPGSAYSFNGGSVITFTEAPKEGDTCKIIFYKGTENVDVVLTDILETIKVGDNITLMRYDLPTKEGERLVTEIISSDTVQTNPYLTTGDIELRPVTWCRQTEDKIISGQEIGKNREIYEPLIQPMTNIIQNIGVGSSEIFVQSVKIFFDDFRENTTAPFKSKILITSQDVIVGASATAIVSAAGTVSSISLLNNGLGFTTSPSVSISNPIGVGTTARATSAITNGSVSSFTITNPGSGYTSSNPPQVLIEHPSLVSEKIENVTYEGDFGIIVGVKTTSVGVASTGIILDLFIPVDSYLRNPNVNVGVATTGISGIKTGYYFMVFNSNIGFGVTSLDSNSSIVGVGTSYLDNVYRAAAVSIAQTSVPGIGLTNVSRVTVSVSNYNGLSGTGFSNFYGEFSWGKINADTRKKPKQFTSYRGNGVSGLTTSAIIQRFNPLKYVGYSTVM